MDWRHKAACVDYDAELWFPLDEDKAPDAKFVCGGCPVRAECANWAIETGQPDGIWGGLTSEQRRKIRGRKAAQLARDRDRRRAQRLAQHPDAPPEPARRVHWVPRYDRCSVCKLRHRMRADGLLGEHKIDGTLCPGSRHRPMREGASCPTP